MDADSDDMQDGGWSNASSLGFSYQCESPHRRDDIRFFPVVNDKVPPMLVDARNSQEVADFLHAPIVIIGAGTVGLFLAVSLVRAKIPVVLIEAGGRVADARRSRETTVSLGKAHIGLALGRAGKCS